jgi:hypothetical protein
MGDRPLSSHLNSHRGEEDFFGFLGNIQGICFAAGQPTRARSLSRSFQPATAIRRSAFAHFRGFALNRATPHEL